MAVNPTIKGFITGATMLIVSTIIYISLQSFESGFRYMVYAVYVAGIVWAIPGNYNVDTERPGFRTYFARGFKCFIVVTLMMVVATWIFLRFNTGLKNEAAENVRADLIAQHNRTTPEIDSMVALTKERFNVVMLSTTMFGYLMIGAFVTGLSSLIISRSNSRSSKN